MYRYIQIHFTLISNQKMSRWVVYCFLTKMYDKGNVRSRDFDDDSF